MRIANTILVCLLVAMVSGSCRMVDTLTGNGKSGTVDALWPDVPAITGAIKSDLALPLGARMAIRAAMQGKVSFIAFTTEKSAQEVQEFYTKERMKSAGWVAAELRRQWIERAATDHCPGAGTQSRRGRGVR